MATTVYDSRTVSLIDGTELYITPAKIKYLREFMAHFSGMKKVKNDDQAIELLVKCTLSLMPQFCPEIKTVDQLEDRIDLPTIYKILGVAADISIDEKKEESVKEQAQEGGTSWDKLELDKLEAEVFLLGIWKDYEELEKSLSMPELLATLDSKRELDYQEKKFFAALQGVDLDKQSGKNDQDAWEKMKAKVFSGGKTTNPDDITSLQGYNAQKAGFGIGLGLDYVDMTKKQ